MRKLVLLAGALATLAACSQSPEEKAAAAQKARDAHIRIEAMQIGGKPVRCLPMSSLNLSMSTPNAGSAKELTGDVRARFLSLEANQAKVRVFTSDTYISGFGSVVVYYVNEQADCLLWAEGLTMQEYSEKAGLNPLGIAQGYEAAKPATPATANPVAPATNPATPAAPAK